MIKVFIDGKEGTTGLEIFDRLSKREDIGILTLSDAKRKDAVYRAEAIAESDITILCLPDAAAVEAASIADKTYARIIDASTAHRTAAGWAYGFPELGEDFKNAIRHGRRVAVPGCHASGFIALVYPLVKLGIMPKDYPATCFSLTGYSGGGKKMIAEYEAADRSGLLDAPRQYALGQQHKHLKEMQGITGLTYAPVFSPVVCDYYRGMEVTVPLQTRLLNGRNTAETLHKALSDFYAGQQLVKVAPLLQEGMLAANALAGANGMEIRVSGGDDRVILTAIFDNLGKGASGAAVECMNIMLGLDEAYGL